MSNFWKVLSSVFTATPERAQGPDLSHWDGSFDPKKAAQRIDFAFMKLTEGTLFVDDKIDEMWEGVKQIAVRGGYHYQRSNFSWEAQAKHFLRIAKTLDLHVYILDLAFYKLWHELLTWIEQQDGKRVDEREKQRVWEAQQTVLRDAQWQAFLKTQQDQWLAQDNRNSSVLVKLVEKIDDLTVAVNNHDTWVRAKDRE